MEPETGKWRELEYAPLLNAEDIAVLLKISKRFAYQLMASGIIPSVRIGRAVRVRESDLVAFLESLDRGSS